MKNRTSLTKSLHTVTVVARLARHLQADKPSVVYVEGDHTDTEACRLALEILGWSDRDHWTRNDATFAACVAKCKAMRLADAAARVSK